MYIIVQMCYREVLSYAAVISYAAVVSAGSLQMCFREELKCYAAYLAGAY